VPDLDVKFIDAPKAERTSTTAKLYAEELVNHFPWLNMRAQRATEFG
jgi:hypothetical protein